MPPKRKRTADENTAAVKRSRQIEQATIRSFTNPKSSFVDLSSSAANQVFSSRLCEAWFSKYATGDEQVMGPQGILDFCSDIGVQPEDTIMLVIAWRMEAENMGFFKLNEWKQGMKTLQCDSVSKLKRKLDCLHADLKDDATFKKIYRFSFNFSREKDQRSLDIETAKEMLVLLLSDRWSLVREFVEYLSQSKYKCMNMDQWNSLLEFVRVVDSNFSEYDEDGAWPVMLDEFVSWYKSKHQS